MLIACAWIPPLTCETFPTPKLPFAPLSYNCHKTSDAIIIDGLMNETDWINAPWTEYFTDIEGSNKPDPFYHTKVKMLYDTDGIYFFAHLEEEHIWASLTERDAVIFYDNDFEIFIDPDGDSHEYYELEINALGTLWDLFLIKPYRDEHSALDAYDIRDIRYAIGINGSLNDPSDIDQYWTVELFIPWKAISQRAHKPIPPQHGDYWRINFSRVHWDHHIIDGKYQKIPKRPEYNWVWSPQGLIAMHYPERWGYVVFKTNTPESTEKPFAIPPTEYAKEYLRQLYYLQKQYFMDHGQYAPNLAKLKAKPFVWNTKSYKPLFDACLSRYTIYLYGDSSFDDIRITEDGRCQSIPKK